MYFRHFLDVYYQFNGCKLACAGIKTFYLELNIFIYLRKRTFNFCKTVLLARNKLILKLCPPNCFYKNKIICMITCITHLV